MTKLFALPGNTCCYTGPKCQFEVQSLSPNTTYHFKVRATTQVDISDFSDLTKVTTDEDCKCFHEIITFSNLSTIVIYFIRFHIFVNISVFLHVGPII